MRRTVDRLKSALQSPFVPLSESDMASFIQKGMQLEKAIAEEAEVLALGDLKVSIDVPAGCTLCWKWSLQRNGPWGLSWTGDTVGFRLMKVTGTSDKEGQDMPWTGMQRSCDGLHGLYTSSSEKPVVGLWGSALQGCTLHLIWDNPSTISDKHICYSIKLMRPADTQSPT